MFPDPLPGPDFLAALAARCGLTDVRPLGTGLEFMVYQAVDRSGDAVVLRVSRVGRFQSNANDRRMDTRALLEWEYRVTGHLGSYGFPVAAPVEFVVGVPDALVSHYVPDDGAGVDPVRLGALLSRLHRLPAPPLSPPASEGRPAWRLLPHRIARRWREVAALVPELPPLPTGGTAGGAADRPARGDSAAPRCPGGEPAVRGRLGAGLSGLVQRDGGRSRTGAGPVGGVRAVPGERSGRRGSVPGYYPTWRIRRSWCTGWTPR